MLSRPMITVVSRGEHIQEHKGHDDRGVGGDLLSTYRKRVAANIGLMSQSGKKGTSPMLDQERGGRPDYRRYLTWRKKDPAKENSHGSSGGVGYCMMGDCDR